MIQILKKLTAYLVNIKSILHRDRVNYTHRTCIYTHICVYIYLYIEYNRINILNLFENIRKK